MALGEVTLKDKKKIHKNLTQIKTSLSQTDKKLSSRYTIKLENIEIRAIELQIKKILS